TRERRATISLSHATPGELVSTILHGARLARCPAAPRLPPYVPDPWNLAPGRPPGHHASMAQDARRPTAPPSRRYSPGRRAADVEHPGDPRSPPAARRATRRRRGLRGAAVGGARGQRPHQPRACRALGP